MSESPKKSQLDPIYPPPCVWVRSGALTLALFSLTLPACSPPSAAPWSPLEQLQSTSESDSSASATATSTPAAPLTPAQMAAELAATRFFLDNPNAQEVSWKQIREAVLDILPNHSIPAQDLPILEEKIFRRPSSGKPTQPAQPDAPAASSPTSPNPAESFGVSVASEKLTAHRGEAVKFTAATVGFDGTPEFQFVRLPKSEEDGVDEVPLMEGSASGSPEFSTSFDQVGNAKVMVRAYDPSGRSARAFAEVEVTNRPPVLKVENIPSGVHRSERIKPLLEAVDPDGDPVNTVIKTSDGNYLTEGSSSEFSIESLGKTELRIVATDSLGSTAEAVQEVTVTNRPPLLEIPNASLKGHPGQPVVLETVTSDPDSDGVKTKVLMGDREISQSEDGKFDLTIDTPGRHELRVQALDEYGGITESIAVVEIENRPPTIALLETPPSTSRNSPVQLVSGISDPDGDPVSVKTVFAGAEKTLAKDEAVSASFAELGEQMVEVIAEDSRGGRTTQKIAVSVTNLPPTLVLTVTPEKIHRNTEAKIIATAADPESEGLLYKFTAPGVESPASTSPELTLTPTETGKTKVSVTVSDPHGGTAQAEAFVIATPRPPELSVKTSGASGSRLDEFAVTVSGRCPETGAEVEKFRILEPAGWKRTDLGFQGKFKELGINKVVVEGISPAGSSSTVEAIITITNLPPVLTIIQPEGPHHRPRPSRFALKYEDPDGPPSPSPADWEVDGGEVISTADNTAVIEFKKLGQASVTAVASDSEGSTSRTTSAVTVENMTPSITHKISPGPYHRGKPVQLKVEVSDADGTEPNPKPAVTVGEASLDQPGPEYAFTPDKLGPYQIKLTARDSDAAVAEEVISIDVENSPPTVELKLPPTPVPLNQEVVIEAVASDLEGTQLSYEFEVNGIRLPSSQSPSCKIAFTKPGKQSVSVAVVDVDGARTLKSSKFDAK